jgi:hypothetical protein
MNHRGQRAARLGDWKYLRVDGHDYLFNIPADERERANHASREPAPGRAARRLGGLERHHAAHPGGRHRQPGLRRQGHAAALSGPARRGQRASTLACLRLSAISFWMSWRTCSRLPGRWSGRADQTSRAVGHRVQHALHIGAGAHVAVAWGDHGAAPAIAPAVRPEAGLVFGRHVFLGEGGAADPAEQQAVDAPAAAWPGSAPWAGCSARCRRTPRRPAWRVSSPRLVATSSSIERAMPMSGFPV